jgi:hypothetical protein
MAHPIIYFVKVEFRTCRNQLSLLKGVPMVILSLSKTKKASHH